MATDTATRTFGVQRLDRDNDLRTDVGTVTFGPQGQLTVVAAQPHCEAYLANVVATVNGKKELNIKVPPPPGGRPGGVYFLTVARTTPDLLEMMRQYLEQKYELLLVDGPES
jgi:hypothetical protein